VARLFVTKNAWAAVVAVLTGIFTVGYPLLPRQLSVIDALTIGVPGFVLSFQPSHDPVRPGFIPRVLRFAIPSGVVMGVATMVVYGIGRHYLELPKEELQSGATMVLIALGLWVLYELSRPLDRVRATLLAAMVLGAVGVFTIGPLADFFKLEIPGSDYLVVIAIAVAIGCVLISVALRLVNRYVPEGPRPHRNAPSDPAGAESA
jgi:cation-transporting ATPase E